jgi:Uma2 family endonuclease
MNVLPKRITVDQYLAWAEGRPGRYELLNGVVHAMGPERVAHAEIKFALQTALSTAIRRAGLPCHMLPDGMTVRIDASTAFEPEALVYCCAKLPPSALEVPNPIIVAEVISPSSKKIDTSVKLSGYFRVPSVMHYLIVDPDRPLITHHARRGDGTSLARNVHEGTIVLDPPGLELDLAEVYEAAKG